MPWQSSGLTSKHCSRLFTLGTYTLRDNKASPVASQEALSLEGLAALLLCPAFIRSLTIVGAENMPYIIRSVVCDSWIVQMTSAST